MSPGAGSFAQPSGASSNAAILLAAGRGLRMQERSADKVLESIGGLPVICYSLNAFVKSGIAGRLLIVYRDEIQLSVLREAVGPSAVDPERIEWVRGGAERQDSVLHALRALPSTVDLVFIHDCARPLIRSATLLQLLELVKKHGAAALAHPVTDTIKQAQPSSTVESPLLLTDLDRTTLWAMETPQAFRRTLITEAYARVQQEGLRVTDDTAALSTLDHPVSLLNPLYPNPKLTTPEDVLFVDFLLRHTTP
ncbi:MAG: IspD/TarI family cytidylyltransferase [Opitutales bacterium]